MNENYNFKKGIFQTLSSSLVFYLSLIITSGLILTVFCNLSEEQFKWFFSSDALYLPSIYKDIFIDGNTVSGWHFNPSPNFFPDLLVYSFLMLITDSFLLSTSLFSVLQWCLIILLYRLVIKQFLGCKNANSLATFSNFFLAIYLIKVISSHDMYFSFYLLINSYHTSVLTVGLLCYFLYTQYLKTNNPILFFVLYFIVFITVVSDKLFIMAFPVPIAIMTLLSFKYTFPYNSKKVKRLGFWIFSSSIFALGTFEIMRSVKGIHFGRAHKMFYFEDIMSTLLRFFNNLYDFIKPLDSISIVIVISVISILFSIVYTIRYLKKKENMSIESLYFLYFTLFSFSIIFAPIVNGNYSNIDCLRYNVYPFYLGALSFPILISKLRFKFGIFRLIMFALFASSYSYIIFNNFSIKKYRDYLSYYPEKVREIDIIASKYKLKNGVGGYWNAKFTTMFSKENIRVYAVHDQMSRYSHASNENWFYNDTVVFDFIIDGDVKHDRIKELFKLDTLEHINSSSNVIKLPEYKYSKNDYSPHLLKRN